MPTRIYTRTGDTGDTGLFGGQRVGKDDLRVEAYGTVDELNSLLGLARACPGGDDPEGLTARLQHELFALGADLATPGTEEEARGQAAIARLPAARVEALEAEIDRLEEGLPPLNRFILPGGGTAAATLHLARSVCRRAERRCVALARVEPLNPEILRYLNRLSDLLFVMARAANARQGVADTLWEKG